jgi:hypothetical protein
MRVGTRGTQRERRRRIAAAAPCCAATLVAGVAGLTGTARASPVDGLPVSRGHVISVSHETDFVGAYGYAPGEPLKIEVYRGEHNIAHVSAHAVQTAQGGGLEVNRGPSGIAVPGDCWEQITADIQPYDRVEVTDSKGIKEAILVDDVRVSTGPARQQDASVALGGHARSAATGDAIAVGLLRGEARADGGLRAAPAFAPGEAGVTGSFRAGFSSTQQPAYGVTRDDRGVADVASAILAGDHTIGIATATERQMADAGGRTGPVRGCEAAPAAGTNAATSLDDAIVTKDSGDLTITGTAAFDVERVEVRVSDGRHAPHASGTGDLVAAPLAPAHAARAWSVTVPERALDSLAQDATLTITAAFVGGTPAPTAAPVLRVRRDIVAPRAPVSTPGPGAIEPGAEVSVRAEAGATVHYTTDGSGPLPSSPTFDLPVAVDATATLKAIAIDPAGNMSPVATLGFTVRGPAGRGPASEGEGPGARSAPPIAAAIPALGAATGSALRVGGVSTSARRMSRHAARRLGVVARFVVPAGAKVVEARLVRLAAAGRRHTLAIEPMTAVPGTRMFARFTTRDARRKLAPGRYVVEVRAGEASAPLGLAATTALHITP